MIKKSIIIALFFLSGFLFAQTQYISPLGFTLSFDKTWKRLPKEILLERAKAVKSFLEYKKDISYDACYQKIGNADMDYPYMLFKNLPLTTSDKNLIRNIKKHFISKKGFNRQIQNVVNGKFDVKLQVGKSYYDEQNKILIFTYDLGVSIKGNLVGMLVFYFGKDASLITYCYSYKDEFKYDRKEFIDVIYSIKDKGMTSTIPNYTNKHNIAVNFYNEGKKHSQAGKRTEAIRFYTKAINNYPVEDKYMKSEAYYNRGLNKRYLNNYEGAIADYTEAINLRPNYFKAYNNRGIAKFQLDDYSGAILDYTMTIKYDNYNTKFSNMALGNRGLAKLLLGQDGCADIKKAIKLGNKKVLKIFNTYCK